MVECSVFLTQIISRRKLSILRRQKWNSCRQFLKNRIFSNIQLKDVNRLSPFKNLSYHANLFLDGVMVTGRLSIT